jgi:hypothetical protein
MGAPPLRDPFGVSTFSAFRTQGSRCAATLGCLMESFRDSIDAIGWRTAKATVRFSLA